MSELSFVEGEPWVFKLTRRIRLYIVECAYQGLRDLLHDFRGLQWIPP